MYFLIKPNTACSTVSELSVVSLYNNREWFQHIEYDTQPVRNMFWLAMLFAQFSIKNVCIFVYKSLILCGEPTM